MLPTVTQQQSKVIHTLQKALLDGGVFCCFTLNMPQPPSYMTPFSRIDYKDISIDFLKQKNFLGYTFQFEGRNYGNKVEVADKTDKALIEATATLFINAISSYEALCKK